MVYGGTAFSRGPFIQFHDAGYREYSFTASRSPMRAEERVFSASLVGRVKCLSVSTASDDPLTALLQPRLGKNTSLSSSPSTQVQARLPTTPTRIYLPVPRRHEQNVACTQALYATTTDSIDTSATARIVTRHPPPQNFPRSHYPSTSSSPSPSAHPYSYPAP